MRALQAVTGHLQFRIIPQYVSDFQPRTMILLPGTRNILPTRQVSVKEAKRYFLQAARILKRLHARGIIHGDIKLDNFALMDGKVVLADFATASYVEEGKDSVPLVMTPFYAAPELLAGKTKGRLTYRTDVYAFGVAFEFACSDKAASVFDKVHRLTVAATPTRRCDDWDVIGRAIRRAGRKRLIAAVAGTVAAFLLTVIGIMEAIEFRYEESLFEEHKELIEADAIRKAAGG